MSARKHFHNFSEKVSELWSSKVPLAAFFAVWSVAVGGFILLAGRFTFLAVNFHGLPRNESFWSFWAFFVCLCIGGWLLRQRAIFVYIAGFPGLLLLDSFGILPFSQIAIGIFNCLVGLWLIQGALRAYYKSIERRWADFLVGCFAATVAISTFYSLAHPSWQNSLSVAFSAFSWNGEMNEFNALWMGHYLLAGCILYLMTRQAVHVHGISALHRAIVVQLIVVAFAWLVFQFYLHAGGEVSGSDPELFPVLSKHDIAGYGLLALGYFVGLSCSRALISKLLPYAGLAVVALCLVFLSASKAALLAIPIALSAILWKLNKTKLIILGVLCLVIVAGWYVATSHSDQFSPELRKSINIVSSPALILADASALERFGIWNNAWNMFKTYPLTGVGLGSSTTLLPNFSNDGFLGTLDWNLYINPEQSNRHFMTHNAYNCHGDLLEVAVSTGIGGLLLLLAIYFFILFLAFGQIKNEHALQINLAGGVVVALLTYFAFSLTDSRLISFAGAVCFWQFIALGVTTTVTPAISAKTKIWGLLPAAVPLLVLLGAMVILATEKLPSGKTYGVWNWNMRASDGAFYLAKEARFVVPPFEQIEALAFRLPENHPMEESEIRIVIDDQKETILKTSKEKTSIFPLERENGKWHTVKLNSPAWSGKGMLGTPLGVQSYSVLMTKLKSKSLD